MSKRQRANGKPKSQPMVEEIEKETSIRKEQVENGDEQHIKREIQKEIKRKVTTKNIFSARPSLLDPTNSKSNLTKSEFRGFYNLLAMTLILFFVISQIHAIAHHGTLVGLDTARTMLGRYELFPSWLVLIAMSFSSFFIQKLFVKGFISDSVLLGIHYTLLSIVFTYCIAIPTFVQWPIIQTGFFLLEMLVILMKMHSYVMTNREFDQKMKNKESDLHSGDGEKYPDNINMKNYFYFLCVPTLVYELNYPRTDKVRISYVVQKVVYLVGIFGIIHVINELYIQPNFMTLSKLPLWEVIFQLLIPSLLFFLLIFYIVFDVICNGFAEMTRFADREFYSDWWNSTTFDEFARKWNKPVHEWLLRHIYGEALNKYKMSQTSAAIVTFLFSSIFHELFMVVTLRIFRPWVFFFQMLQLPLIFIGRKFKGKTAGNFGFWFGMLFGPPLITCLYMREYYSEL